MSLPAIFGAQSFADAAAAAVYAAGWLALLLAPWRHRFCWIFARSCAVFLALGYSALLICGYTPNGLWHFLLIGQGTWETRLLAIASLSLFVGSWQVEDSRRHEIPHSALLPCLLLTALTGAIGFAFHLGLRDFFKWRSKKRRQTDLPRPE